MRARHLMILLLALPLGLAACGDKKADCGVKCSKIHDEGDKKCGAQDADCWAPIQAATDACFKACDAAK